MDGCHGIRMQQTSETDSSNVVSRQPICMEYCGLMRLHKFRWTFKSCRWLRQKWGGKVFVVHPVSGWWEPARMYDSKTMVCSCRFYDARGFLLIQGTRFLVNLNVLRVESKHDPQFLCRQLAIDYVKSEQFVKYYDIRDHHFCDDIGPLLTINDIISVSAFSKLFSAARSFLQSKTLCWVRESRRSLRIVCWLCLKDVLRFSFCSRGIWNALSSGKMQSDLRATHW